jgi:hypothetical protein
MIGASGETRTLKVLPPVDFESTASTDSATLALPMLLCCKTAFVKNVSVRNI